MQQTTVFLLALTLLGSTIPVASAQVSVRDYGAKGDDKTDDTEAFVAALRASRDVYVPAGVYQIGTIELSDQTWLHGAGRASVIRFVSDKDSRAAIYVGTACRVSSLRLTGTEPFENWITGKGSMEPVLLRAQGKRDIQIDRVQLDDFRHNGIWIDNCEDVRIENCVLEKLYQGLEIDNCKRVHVAGNRLREMRNHGIQFWGQSNFTSMHCEDLIFANNYVFRGGSGAIWGTGARRVVMSGNIVDGAKDVGLDLEWCYDCTITGNTTKNCWNAGIALFLSCQNISISGNSIFIDDGQEGRRDGIWLTGVNRGLYRKDFGHRQVSITGNTVRAEGKTRHGISIGSGYDIVCAANTMRNADVLDRTGRAQLIGRHGPQQPSESMAGAIVLPLGPEWRFAIDPDDEGITNRWFDPHFDDAIWSTIRSDQPGIGWEGQGFGGPNGKGYEGFAWYRVPLPKLPSTPSRYAYLHFGMTDEQAWIYLNGKQVGEHSVQSEGKTMQAIWDEPFGIEISQHLKPNVAPNLALRIHNAALAGGLRRPASLILSERPLTVTQQIRITAAYRRQRVVRGSTKWTTLLRDGATLLFRDSFEKYDIGNDPARQFWSYGEHGNDQWEGDTTYVVDETTHGIPSYDGGQALYLEQFTHNNQWDVTAHPIITFPAQTSGVVRTGFALYLRAGLSLAFGDSQQKSTPWTVLIRKDGKIHFRDKERWEQSKLEANIGQWNTFVIELTPGGDKATLTLNKKHTAHFPIKTGAVDQVQFRTNGYGSVLLDSLMVVHTPAR